MPSYQSDLMATPAKRVIRGFESLTRFQNLRMPRYANW
jgi:hypothetical protein